MAKKAAISNPLPTPTDKLIAPGDLLFWEHNPREKHTDEDIAQLKANIDYSKAVLQNLVVAPDSKAPGKYKVLAGEGRRIAVAELVKEKKLAKDFMVLCRVFDVDPDGPDAMMISLSENHSRTPMNAIHECVAMVALVQQGKSITDLAYAFRMSETTVRQRLALGRLIPEARDLVRAGTRDLDWAQAMTLADASMQHQITTDVTNNPESWKTGKDVRRFLTTDTLEAKFALFDINDYKGGIIHDMFDGDRFTDRADFWTLQNAAVEELRDGIAAEGWKKVTISHNPVDLWRFHTSNVMAESEVIIEVSPNGAVNIHKGLVVPEGISSDQPVEGDHGANNNDDDETGLVGDAVRVTPRVAEYAAAHRTAQVQTALSDNFRKSLEVAAAGLLGHSEISIRANDYRYPGGQTIRTGESFAKVDVLHNASNAMLQEFGLTNAGQNRDKQALAVLKTLSDEDLQTVFCRLVATKVGQTQTKALDTNEGSICNTLGSDLAIDIRRSWTPDIEFFMLMKAPDLRRLVMSLLPERRRQGALTAPTKHLARMLADAFKDAADKDGTLDAATITRLNTWVPGVMRYPASDDSVSVAVVDTEDEDIFASVFTGNDDMAPVEEELAA